ncbi:unnamed protein product, partial [Dicrocoelium dendriticum]
CLSATFQEDACNEDASRFIDIAEAFSVLGNNETRQQYDAKRKLMAFGLFGDGFKMHYPAPHSDLSEEVLNAYNDEMRRCAITLIPPRMGNFIFSFLSTFHYA